MIARTARLKAGPVDPREAVAAAARERGDSLAALSRMLDRRPSYLSAFVREGVPKALTPRDHGLLVAYFGRELGMRDLWDCHQSATIGAGPKPAKPIHSVSIR